VLKDLAPFAVALAAPDLPLVVWCRSARLVDRREFWELARMSHKIILDSGQLGEPLKAIGRVSQAVRDGFLIGDLAWARLTRWRETLAQVFENPKYAGLLPGVSAVRITAPPGRETSAMYLRAWLDRALKAAGAKPSIEIATGDSPSVDLSGEGLHVEQTAVQGPLVITVNGLSQCTSLPQPTDYLTVREELAIMRRDPVFEESLP
jgi:glucose-6-phosphate dehydrogenase assembly protein OpcA